MFQTMQLGRKAIVHQPARKRLAHRLLDALPAPPTAIDNTKSAISWGMMLNDQLGDCTCAGLAHSLQVATLNGGSEVTASDSEVLAAYERYCGYKPADSSTDQGGIETDVLAGVMSDGFAGRKLLGWVSPDPSNLDHVRKAIYYFKSIYIGAELPLSAQQGGGVWDASSGPNGQPGGWGGHCMVGASYDSAHVNWITWGVNQTATLAWFQKYVDEVHVLLWDVLTAQLPPELQGIALQTLQSLND